MGRGNWSAWRRQSTDCRDKAVRFLDFPALVLADHAGNRVKSERRNKSMMESTGTRPFAAFEWMLSLRYLRARRKEGFISVIAGFSFLGILLGVATLIIVMAVMNGFRKELLDKILGLNGHLLIQPLDSPLTDWEAVAARISKLQGITLAAPIVEGQALASSPFNASGVLVRGIRVYSLVSDSLISSPFTSATR
jgi:lipoprotein-releasing system permease protein